MNNFLKPMHINQINILCINTYFLNLKRQYIHILSIHTEAHCSTSINLQVVVLNDIGITENITVDTKVIFFISF